MEDYFDAVQVQLNALCQARAHRRGWTRAHWTGLTPSTGVVLVSALITAAVFVVAVGSLSGRGREPAQTRTGRAAAPDSAAQRALAALDGVPQSGTRLGDAHAPVTITVFSDLECPGCRTFALGQAFRRLVAHQVRSGRVSIDFRSFCTTTCSSKSTRIFGTQQIAAYAAADQNRFWDYALIFFAEQRAGSGYANAAYLKRLARQVPGLNLGRWQKERRTPAPAARLRGDAAIARTDHVLATPTLIVARANAHVTLIGVPSDRQLISAIDKVTRAPAASANAVVKACLATGHLNRPYSRAQLLAALRSMPASVRQYSDCPDVIRRALRTAR
jgi:protein-disulfide isomerase